MAEGDAGGGAVKAAVGASRAAGARGVGTVPAAGRMRGVTDGGHDGSGEGCPGQGGNRRRRRQGGPRPTSEGAGSAAHGRGGRGGDGTGGCAGAGWGGRVDGATELAAAVGVGGGNGAWVGGGGRRERQSAGESGGGRRWGGRLSKGAAAGAAIGNICQSGNGEGSCRRGRAERTTADAVVRGGALCGRRKRGWGRGRVYHISARNWKIAASSPFDGPQPMNYGTWPVARSLGGYFRIVHFLPFVCLPGSFVCRHSLRSLVMGRSIDQCPRFY